jgi:hypothetical protein
VTVELAYKLLHRTVAVYFHHKEEAVKEEEYSWPQIKPAFPQVLLLRYPRRLLKDAFQTTAFTFSAFELPVTSFTADAVIIRRQIRPSSDSAVIKKAA